MDDYEYKLSSIVLVYNGGEYLRPCIDSLVNQTLEGLEIILVNDKSTDDSLSVCREYERDYDNVRVIDKDKNEGLATSANLGIRNAKGEYVILVDNDDIIPNYAYEKLYNKAKEVDADICLGQANYLNGKYQQELEYHQTNVWEKERVIHDVNDFPVLFHDAFYWNKIMKKSFVLDNDLKLPTGMIYADRYFSHMAYIKAKTIAIIPDTVYLWRIRRSSLSMGKREGDNYINRIDSYELDLNKLTTYCEDYFKILIRRVLIPINGIIESPEFEKVYKDRGYKILKNETGKLNNVYDNDLNNFQNICLYLTLNQKYTELNKFLHLDIKKQTEIFNENGKSYWKLPLFRNDKLEIPDKIFEIKFLEEEFIKIDAIEVTEDSIIFDNIEFPKYLSIKKGEVLFVGRTFEDEILEENTVYSIIKPKGNNEEKNLFKAEIKKNELKTCEVYDIYFKTHYENKIFNKFKMPKSCIRNIKNKSNDIAISETNKNYLVISSNLIDKKFKINIKKDKILLLVDNGEDVKKLNIFFKNEITNEKTKLTLNKEKTAFELEWKFFLDENSTYSLNISPFSEKDKANKNIKFNEKYLKEFKESIIKNNENMKIKLYKTKYGNIRLKSGK